MVGGIIGFKYMFLTLGYRITILDGPNPALVAATIGDGIQH